MNDHCVRPCQVPKLPNATSKLRKHSHSFVLYIRTISNETSHCFADFGILRGETEISCAIPRRAVAILDHSIANSFI